MPPPRGSLSKILLDHDVFCAALTHANASYESEIMGLLIGKVCFVSSLKSCVIPTFIPPFADSRFSAVEVQIVENNGDVVAHIQFAPSLVRTERLSDRVEIDPDRLVEGSALAEQESESSKEDVRVLGWYHSHPKITALPSKIDLRTQLNFQIMEKYFCGVVIAVFSSRDVDVQQSTVIRGFQTKEVHDTVEEIYIPVEIGPKHIRGGIPSLSSGMCPPVFVTKSYMNAMLRIASTFKEEERSLYHSANGKDGDELDEFSRINNCFDWSSDKSRFDKHSTSSPTSNSSPVIASSSQPLTEAQRLHRRHNFFGDSSTSSKRIPQASKNKKSPLVTVRNPGSRRQTEFRLLGQSATSHSSSPKMAVGVPKKPVLSWKNKNLVSDAAVQRLAAYITDSKAMKHSTLANPESASTDSTIVRPGENTHFLVQPGDYSSPSLEKIRKCLETDEEEHALIMNSSQDSVMAKAVKEFERPDNVTQLLSSHNNQEETFSDCGETNAETKETLNNESTTREPCEFEEDAEIDHFERQNDDHSDYEDDVESRSHKRRNWRKDRGGILDYIRSIGSPPALVADKSKVEMPPWVPETFVKAAASLPQPISGNPRPDFEAARDMYTKRISVGLQNLLALNPLLPPRLHLFEGSLPGGLPVIGCRNPGPDGRSADFIDSDMASSHGTALKMTPSLTDYRPPGVSPMLMKQSSMREQ
ncbi:unnamed protein product [Notodromas monacha]|uniref:MPN domain-containing protein n=1 Tax=Notodromas monacha TaxID=399045 RepID=A0A7R9BK63_9CRUS|nr:unnamed protein product [Notodromas monacha]CAG0915879.1 unnamed protein product [Notodromas monacha]